MDIQGQIIALLQGDMRNRNEIATLMRSLASSPEEMNVLLQQIDLSRHISLLAKGVPAAPLTARNSLDNRIEEFEAKQRGSGPKIADTSRSTLSRSRQRLRRLPLLFLLLAGMASSVGIGYMLGARSTAETVVRHHIVAPPQKGVEEKSESPSATPAPLHTAEGKLGGERSHVEQQLPPHVALHTTPPSPQSNWTDSSLLPTHFSAAPPTMGPEITLLGPSGGEQFGGGDIIPITWTGNAAQSPVTLEISPDGGKSWQVIAEDVRENKFLWPISEEMKSGSEYLLRVNSKAVVHTDMQPRNIITIDTHGISVDISPNGRYLVTGGRDTLVTLWDLHTNRRLAAMTGHGAAIQSCRFNYDGTKVVTTAMDGTASIWDVESRTQERILDGEKGYYVWWATFSPDGKRVVTCHNDGTVILWDAATGIEDSRFHPHAEGVRYAEFTPDGTRLLTTSVDRTASISDVRTGMTRKRFVHSTITPYVGYPSKKAMNLAIVNAIQLTKDGSVAITCGHNGEVKFWDAQTGTLIRSRSYHNGAPVSMVRLTADDKVLISVGDDGTMAIIDTRTGALLSRRSIESAGTQKLNAEMVHIGIGSDPNIVAVSHMDGHVSIWDITPQKNISQSYWTIK